jgi:hypothetical protein
MSRFSPVSTIAGTLLAMLISPLAAPLAAQHRHQRDDSDAGWIARCDRDNGNDYNVKHCEARVSGLKATGATITIDPGQNGGAVVRGWDRDSIEVHARIQTQAGSESDAAGLARGIRVSIAGGHITAAGPSSLRRHSWSVTFVVYAPRRSDLTLETYNGPVEVEDVTGKLDLSAVNGPVVLSSVGGDVHARARNGPMVVELGGTTWDGAGLDAETTNGPVELSLPREYNGVLETGTVNGPMSVDFPMTIEVRGRITHRIKATLGAGGPLIRVVTTNGPVEIHRLEL